MSFGDTNKFSIPTVYRRIEMRSIFETDFANHLDRLNIKWEYEPKLFKLSNGVNYKPDFYLPELKMWVEIKGVIGINNKQISKIFAQDNATTLLLLSYNEAYWYSYDSEFEEDGGDTFQIGCCSDCKKEFFCTGYGLFSCRHCGNWDGDHDIYAWIDGGFNNLKKEVVDYGPAD